MSLSLEQSAWRIPRYLDEPIRFGPLTGGEAGLVFGSIIIGLLTQTVFVSASCVCGLIFASHRLRARYGKGWLIQFFYLFWSGRIGAAPPRWMRVLRG